MAKRLTLNQLSPQHQAQALAQGAKPEKKKSKRGNCWCKDARGRSFQSKMERDNHLMLERQHQSTGNVVLRQVSIIVSDGPKPTRHVIDHVVLYTVAFGRRNPRIAFADTKGRITTQDRRTFRTLLNMGIDLLVLLPRGRRKYASEILEDIE